MSGFENGKNKPSISLFYEMSMFFDDLDLRWLITGKGSMDEACVEEDAADYEVINKRAQRLNQFFNEWMATHDADEQAWLEIQIKNTLPEYADFLINRAED